MAGTIYIDQPASFAAMLLMSSGPKLQFNSTEQDVDGDGQKKWTIDVATTFRTEPGSKRKAAAEVMSVTVTGPGEDPAARIAPGSLVTFDKLRQGFSAPEKGTNDRIRGGRPYYMADGVSAAPSPVNGQSRPLAGAAKSD
jgi:hypothetical protein